MNRRRFLKQTFAAAAGGAMALSLEEQALAARSASAPASEPPASAEPFPTGRLGGRAVSRLLCGGNLISGFAHSRDLIYVSSLLKNYFTDEKIWETLHLCEQHGINTALLRCDNHVIRILDAYWKHHGGKIQWIAQVNPSATADQTNIQRAIDHGAFACQIQGGFGDRWVTEGRVDLLEKAVRYIQKAGLAAGVGGHLIEVPIAVEAAGIEPDFYMKTLHRTDYWSYSEEGNHDNSWCATPEQTVRFMADVKRPWIAFKVLAAGAIHPRLGLQYAFDSGADFACVGMFDFQVAADVAIARKVLAGVKRDRPWQS